MDEGRNESPTHPLTSVSLGICSSFGSPGERVGGSCQLHPDPLDVGGCAGTGAERAHSRLQGTRGLHCALEMWRPLE